MVIISNSAIKILRNAKKILTFHPQTNSRFVLDEHRPEDNMHLDQTHENIQIKIEEIDMLLRYAERLDKYIDKVCAFLRKEPSQTTLEDFKKLKNELDKLVLKYNEMSPINLTYVNSIPSLDKIVSLELEENKLTLEDIYQLPNNSIVLRKFYIPLESPVKAMVVFMDGLVDKEMINISILSTLMDIDRYKNVKNISSAMHLIENLLPHAQNKIENSIEKIVSGINNGETILFIDGLPEAIIIDTRSWEHRNVDRPQIEQTLKGSQEAFGEVLGVNIALIRRWLKTPDLVNESVIVGSVSHTQIMIVYLKSIANPELVNEIKRRLKEIQTDYINQPGDLQSFIEDHPNVPFPQSLTTERPDRVAGAISEGKVAIFLDDNPFVMIVPVSFFSFFHSGDDFALKWQIATFMRLLRFFGFFVGMLLPALYLAISTFHQEALPTELALAIAGSRERVPFPVFIEVLLLEISFEFIREAGVRIPGMLGSTIGIVGAIILGQAAVAANIVSPIMVVIIAMAGVASYLVPDFTMGFGARILRFAFLVLAATSGLVGIGCGILLFTMMLCYMKSFGMPYLSPVAPKSMAGLDVVIRGQAYRQKYRPDELNPLRRKRQPPKSTPGAGASKGE